MKMFAYLENYREYYNKHHILSLVFNKFLQKYVEVKRDKSF